VSVVDGDGSAIALSHSLGSSSGVITPGLGAILSYQTISMINFYPYAGPPQQSIAPRKGRTGGMAPTLVYQGDRLRLVLGSPGATAESSPPTYR